MSDQVALHNALAVAMAAIVNDLDQLAVSDMLTRAEELLDHASPLYVACTGFATQYQVCHHDPDALAMQGRILKEAVHREMGLVPDTTERRIADG